MPSLSDFSSSKHLVARYTMSAPMVPDRLAHLTDRQPVDWSRPVQFQDGTPCAAERVSGFILVTFDDSTPPAGLPAMGTRYFGDSLVCYEDDGSIYGHEDGELSS